jgi:hypothetical protein
MKFLSFESGNSPAMLALMLLAMMLGSGTVSGLVGYKMGSEALKGVGQPDTNPTKKKIVENQETSSKTQEFVPIDEKTILTQVYDRINGKSEKSKVSAQKKEENRAGLEQSTQKTESSQNSPKKVSLPLKTEDGSVTLEVVKASQQGGSLVLDVNLSNRGTDTVRFLYSFLEIKDNQGRPLSAIVEGLPGELPANKETFSGSVKIPLELIDEGQQLSLNLTDYPDQKLKLNIANIPSR